MAIFNEILAGRFNKALVKLFNMKSAPAAPSAALGSEIIPAIQMYYGNECRALEGWQRFGIGASIGASVGNISVIQMLNPAGSKTIAVLEKLTVSNNTGASQVEVVTYGITGVGIGTGLPQLNAGLDNRGITGSTVQFTSKNNTAAGPNGVSIYSAVVPTLSSIDLIQTDDQELTLAPGSFYQFSPNAVNLEARVSIWWRERPLEDSELSL